MKVMSQCFGGNGKPSSKFQHPATKFPLINPQSRLSKRDADPEPARLSSAETRLKATNAEIRKTTEVSDQSYFPSRRTTESHQFSYTHPRTGPRTPDRTESHSFSAERREPYLPPAGRTDPISKSQSTKIDLGVDEENENPRGANDRQDRMAVRRSAPLASFVRRRTGPCGMKNLGNTCFLNATLQCLLNTEPLVVRILEGDFQVNGKNGLKGQLTDAFAAVVKDAWESESVSTIVPSKFKSCIGNWAHSFQGYSQHDAQEFLRFLLDGLHEEMNRITVPPKYEELQDIDGEQDRATSERWWNNYANRNDSLIVDVFGGQLKSVVKCGKCQYVSKAFDPFMDLSLTLKSNNRDLTLYDCFQRYVDEEKLKGNDCYYCSKCKKQREAVRRMSIYRLPRVLVIHLKRFAYTSQLRFGGCKLMDNVDFPVKLDMSDFIDENARGVQQPLYELFGVVNHMGSLTGGHYTSFCQSPLDGKWYQFDDSFVTQIPFSKVNGPAAYVLFYKRVES